MNLKILPPLGKTSRKGVLGSVFASGTLRSKGFYAKCIYFCSKIKTVSSFCMLQRTTQISLIVKVFIVKLCEFQFFLYSLAARLPVMFYSQTCLAYTISSGHWPDDYEVTSGCTTLTREHKQANKQQIRFDLSEVVWGCLLCAKSWSELSRPRFFDDVFSPESNLSAEKKLLDLFFSVIFRHPIKDVWN